MTAVLERSTTIPEPAATTRPARTSRPSCHRLIPFAGFWLAAAAFLIAMAFSTIPTPLYVLYQQRDGFSSFVVTVVFAVYAVGVIIGLLLAGHVSDWMGVADPRPGARRLRCLPPGCSCCGPPFRALSWPDSSADWGLG